MLCAAGANFWRVTSHRRVHGTQDASTSLKSNSGCKDVIRIYARSCIFLKSHFATTWTKMTEIRRFGVRITDIWQKLKSKKKLLNPFEWTQHTLDNFTSCLFLICGEEMLNGYWVFDFCVFLLDVLKATCYKHWAKRSKLLHAGIVQWYFKQKTCFHENKCVPNEGSRRPRHHLTQI